ncbi:PREDICTED: G-protein coupled receptor 84-like [Branchiostoma belcheri]|uniref:G-protein coupled receptor 84-like n=1 Tax=Branchiostoma belcheri TaxID=7741 RepID=A0A6P4ZFI9_BRABE|nr:PREDICTED: G-protein coupled receptor 84-like [Branchiostoma belcheri]
METPGWIYVVVTILGIIIAVTLIGCLLTVLAIWTRPVLRKLVNAPLVSLSCTDILSSSFGAPLLIHAFLHPDWEPPGALCWLQSYVTIVLWGASSCHMACIALQRYFMVCTNSVYLKSKRVLFIILLLTWLIPTVSFLPIHVVEEVKVHPKLKRCGLGASPNLWGKIVPSILSFYGPFIATITLYALIRYHVRKSKKRVGAHLGNSSPNNAAEKQLTRMMMTLFSVYTVCYMPLITMAMFSSRVPREAFIVGQVLMALNGALNPILYGLMNRNIRQGYKHIWNSMLNYIV